jgi:hypothetical protein
MTGYLLLAGWFFFNLLAASTCCVDVLELPGQGMGDAVARLN